MKRGLSSEEQMATDEEVLRFYTKIKKAYDKGLAKELLEESSIEDAINSVDAYIKHKKIREGHSIGILKTLEKSLDESIKKYGIVLDDEASPLLEDQIANDEEVIRVFTKQKNAFEKGLGEKIYRDPSQTEGILLNIDIALSDKKRRGDYSVSRIKAIEQELDEQMKEYGFEEVKEEVNLGDVVNKYLEAIRTRDIDTIFSLRKYIPEEKSFDFIRTACPKDVINFLNKKRKALKNGLASHIYDNEYQEDAAYFDIQNKLNDHIGIHMHNEAELKQMEQELDEQIKKYNIVVD